MHTIETENLLLRPFTEQDAPAYHDAVLSNEIAMRALPTGRPVPPQRARSIVLSYMDDWELQGYGLWAVILKETNQLIGHCGFQQLDQKPAVELVYTFHPDYIASELPIEAVRACMRYGFETLVMEEIMAVILPGNEGCKRVYQRLDFQPKGKIHAYNHYLPYYGYFRGNFLADKTFYHVYGENA